MVPLGIVSVTCGLHERSQQKVHIDTSAYTDYQKKAAGDLAVHIMELVMSNPKWAAEYAALKAQKEANRRNQETTPPDEEGRAEP